MANMEVGSCLSEDVLGIREGVCVCVRERVVTYEW